MSKRRPFVAAADAVLLVVVSLSAVLPSAASASEPDKIVVPGEGIDSSLAGAPVADAQAVETFELRAGRAVFWDGPRHIDQPVFLLSEVREAICERGGPGCIDYRLVVSEPADRLRVALDFGTSGDLTTISTFALYLIDPQGNQVAKVAGFTDDIFFSAEVFAEDPAPGAWTARVVPHIARDATFRMRAKLEEATARPNHARKPVRPLLPNLRMTPPWAFTLKTPALPGVGGAAGAFDAGPGRGVVPTRGCQAIELATHDPAPTRCLRFSTGPQNVGDGGLQLIFRPDGTSLTEGPAFQRIDLSDGTTEDRPAGRYEYHLAHAHYHHGGFAGFTLLRVTDPKTGALEHAGPGGPKAGWCMTDIRIADWAGFDNDPAHTVEQGDCLGVADSPTTPLLLGLSRGWADEYVYATEGNYVDFGDNPDGLYVVRVEANDRDSILESTSGDNTSYALVRVTGDEVEVLERGYGQDPWDPHRQEVHDLLPPTADD